jgi:type II secretion system protein L
LQFSAVIRRVTGTLVWYPPGAGTGSRALDDEEGREALREFVAGRRKPLLFAAPGSDVRLVTVPFKPAERRHIIRSLPYALEEQLAEDVEALHFASRVIADGMLGVAICRHEDMSAWQDQLASLPAPTHWVPEPLLLPWQSGEWCIVVEADSAVARTGAVTGFSVEPALLEVFLAGALAESGERPATVVVYGTDQAADTALLPPGLRERVQWRAGDFATALILARDEVAGPDLLQGAYAPRLPLDRWWRQWRAVAAVLAAAFLVQLGATYAGYRELQAQNLALRGEIESLFREVYPQGRMQDAEKQIQRRLDALRGAARSGGFTPLVYAVGEAVSAQPGTRVVTLNYTDSGGDMRLNLIARDFEAVEAIRAAMTTAGLRAVMESSNAQGDVVRARMRVEAG